MGICDHDPAKHVREEVAHMRLAIGLSFPRDVRPSSVTGPFGAGHKTRYNVHYVVGD